jgi:hypothetical protein
VGISAYMPFMDSRPWGSGFVFLPPIAATQHGQVESIPELSPAKSVGQNEACDDDAVCR